MKNLELIAAIGKNNELGFNNNLIWHINDDLKNFKNITMGKNIVMGMKTFISIPNNLEGRKYVILTSKNITIPNKTIYHSKEQFIKNMNDNEKYIVIGGGQIYKLFIDDVDTMYITHINDSFKVADTYFPKFNEEEFDKELLMEGTDKVHYKQYKYVRR